MQPEIAVIDLAEAEAIKDEPEVDLALVEGDAGE